MNHDLIPGHSKVHVATWNGEEDPLDVYLSGKFDEWQRWQTKKNFERQYVISLIKLPQTDRWLFAGVYRSQGSEWLSEEGECGLYYYNLVEDSSCIELAGRMVAQFTRSGRQSYLNAENWTDEIILAEIYAERLTVGEFPGFRAVNLSREQLELIVNQSLESWRTALSNVAGVYLISDTVSGGLYVGAAYGEGGIWQRWQKYVTTGTGGNKELQNLLTEHGEQHLSAFHYSILEIADIHTGKDDILRREVHWKDVLLTRSHGLNAN